MMRCRLKTGSKFLLVKDEVTNVLYIQYVRPLGPFVWLIVRITIRV